MTILINTEDLRLLEEQKREDESTRARREAALTLAATARDRIRAERNGVPLPDSAEVLDKLREERLHELASLR